MLNAALSGLLRHVLNYPNIEAQQFALFVSDYASAALPWMIRANYYD